MKNHATPVSKFQNPRGAKDPFQSPWLQIYINGIMPVWYIGSIVILADTYWYADALGKLYLEWWPNRHVEAG